MGNQLEIWSYLFLLFVCAYVYGILTCMCICIYNKIYVKVHVYVYMSTEALGKGQMFSLIAFHLIYWGSFSHWAQSSLSGLV